MDSYLAEKLAAMLEACRSAVGRHARGSTLEDLVEYIFAYIPSVTVYARDIKDDSGAQEVDLVLNHFQHVSRLPIPDVTIIVECKNEKRRTSAAHVREFGNKLRTRSVNIGILVTFAGLSGKPDKHGHSAIRDELQNGVSIIVVTAGELANLGSPDDLAELLTLRLTELRTFRTYRSI